MSIPRSHTIITALAFTMVAAGLAGCVPSADDDTSDTLTPLSVATIVSSTVFSPATITPTTVAVGVITGAATTAPITPEQAAANAAAIAAANTTTTATPAATTTTKPVSATATTVAATAKGTYTVVAKDTLYGIARGCKVGPQVVADLNGWTDGIDHLLVPGAVVKLPCEAPAATSSATSTTSAAAAGATTTTKPATGSATSTTVDPSSPGVYTIVAGDYLALIAQKTGTTIDKIVEANGWPEGREHVIIPGQQIKMPTG